MKYFNIHISACALCLMLVACNNEPKMIAKQSIDTYGHYMDSIANLDFEVVLNDWENVESQIERVRQNAQYSLEKLTDSLELQNNLNTISKKYKILKSKILIEKELLIANSDDNQLYADFFGPKYEDDQLSLEWVNDENILSVYQNFLYACQKNKNHYNSDDYNNIKLAFSALCDRKYTLIQDGLLDTEVDKINVIERKFKDICDGRDTANP